MIYCLHVKGDSLQKGAILIAACMYAFSTYAFFYGMQWPAFLDIMVFMPLAVAGIEHLLQGKVRILIPSFLFAFWAQALSGFYSFYMLTVFCVLYFVVCGINRLKNWREFFQRLGIAAMNYLLAIGLAAAIFIPSVSAFLGSSRSGDSGIRFQDIFRLYDVNEILQKLNSLFVKEGYQSGLGLPVFCGLLLILLFCRENRKRYKEYKILLLIFGTGYFLPIFGSVMNGFAYSTDRWMVMLIFLLALLTGELFSEEQIISRGIVVSQGLLALLWCGIFWTSHKYSSGVVMEFIIYAAMWIGVTVILVRILQKKQGTKRPFFYIYGLGTIAVSSFLVNAPVSIGGGGWSACFLPMKEVYAGIENSMANVAYDDNEAFYRTDICDASLASSLVLGYNGTTCYYSMFNHHIYDFYRELKISPAIRGSSFCVKGLDNREILQNMLSVRYKAGEDGNVVKNEDDRPFGILYSSYCLEEDVEQLSALEREVLLRDAVILSEYPDNSEISVVKQEEYELYRDAVTQIDCDIEYENMKYKAGELNADSEGTVLLEWEADADTEQYILLKNLVLLESDIVEIEVGDKSIQLRSKENSGYLNGDHDYLIHVPSDTGREQIVFLGGQYYLDRIMVYEVKTLQNQADPTWRTDGEQWKFENNRVWGEITAEQESILFLSIPYSEGWRIKLDGKTVDSVCADWGFTAIAVPSGSHVIEAHYHTPGLKEGMIIAILSIMILILLAGYQRKTEKN